MKVAILHYKYGTDGVSLEIQKRLKVLRALRVKPFVIAGSGTPDAFAKSLDGAARGVMLFNRYAFETYQAAKARTSYKKLKKRAKGELLKILSEIKPDFLIIHNIFSLAYNLPVSAALKEIIEEKNLKSEAIHHDFWWDRDIFNTRLGFVRELMLELLPPYSSQIVSHVVINSIEYEKLLKRKGIKSKLFGDLFDFEEANTVPANEMRKRLKLRGVVFLQATRIVRRKAIEVTIDLVRKFKQETGNNALILLTNPPERYVNKEYFDQIKKYAKQNSVRLVAAFERTKDIPFFEFYKVADFVAYPSINEGFGNQFLEAVFYRKLPIVFEYEVFKKDIKPEGYSFISLGDRHHIKDNFVKIPEKRLEGAVRKINYYYHKPKLYASAVAKNFQTAKRFHSPKLLENYYRALFASVLIERSISNIKQLFELPRKEILTAIKKLIKV